MLRTLRLRQKMFSYKKQHAKNKIFEESSHLGITNFIKLFRVIILISYLMKTPEAFWFPGVFKRYKMGTVATNG